MENAFLLQLEEISRKMDELVSEEPNTPLFSPAVPFQQDFLNRINVRSAKLKEYDSRATRALEERNLLYREWKAWEPNKVPLNKGFRLAAKPKYPPSEITLVAAYDNSG